MIIKTKAKHGFASKLIAKKDPGSDLIPPECVMNEGKAVLADEIGGDVEPVSQEETEALIAEAVSEGENEIVETEEL